MQTQIRPNSLDLTLGVGERIYVKSDLLREPVRMEWRMLPVHPLGSFLGRVIHGLYCGLKYVEGGPTPIGFSLLGSCPRGDFFVVNIPRSREMYVDLRHVVGFTDDIDRIHTKIRLGITYFCLRRHFFYLFQGPGSVILYAPSPFEINRNSSCQPERVVCFDASRAFRARAPSPIKPLSKVINFFRHDVLWEFLDSGETICLAHNPDNEQTKSVWRHAFVHLLGFFRL